MTALVVRGDALHLPLRDNTVDLVVTSPSYFALRDYGTGHPNEVGREPTPQAYLEALWAVTAELKRVLKPTGSIWINLGDKYATAGTRQGHTGVRELLAASVHYGGRIEGIPEKSLMGLPWRYAIGCIDHLGLILRRDLIWDKANPLPESAGDRTHSSHEYWFHWVKSPRYYSAIDELRAAAIGDPSKLGKWPGSVWRIPSQPLKPTPWIDTQHYAAFPTEWPRRLILGFTPHLICLVCGVGRFPVVARRNRPLQATYNGHLTNMPNDGDRRTGVPQVTEATIVGYACGCTPFTDHPGTEGTRVKGTHPSNIQANPGGGVANYDRHGPWREYHLDRWTPPPGRPALVLDPFGGTGTVLHVAYALGRHAISIDLSEAYCRVATDQTLARWRAGKVAGRVNLERQGSLL